MKILIISDAWHPQINGVVRTLEATVHELGQMGHEVRLIGPDVERWCALPMPTYPEITLEFFARRRVRRILREFRPDVVHIATEGPLGAAARRACMSGGRPFTTSYHTHYPDYIAARLPAGLGVAVRLLTYAYLRRFRAPSSAVMVATASLEAELRRRKFRHLVRWPRGVDTARFRPRGEKAIAAYEGMTRPILLYIGRVAVEKNIPAFLQAKVPGTKVVIGLGPDRARLASAYPDAHFLGKAEGEALAEFYAGADIFVFPSLTDTFGLVLLEACASGLRVAACPAPGPRDIFSDRARTGGFSALDADLNKAITAALALADNPALPRAFAESQSWRSCTEQFFDHLQMRTPAAVRRLRRLRNWLSRLPARLPAWRV